MTAPIAYCDDRSVSGRLLRGRRGADEHGQTRAGLGGNVNVDANDQRLRVAVADEGVGGTNVGAGPGLIG
jgi:hypothetical protein